MTRLGEGWTGGLLARARWYDDPALDPWMTLATFLNLRRRERGHMKKRTSSDGRDKEYDLISCSRKSSVVGYSTL